MIFKLKSIRVSQVHLSLELNFSFVRSIVDNDLQTLVNQRESSFLLSPRHILSFVTPWSTMIRAILLIKPESSSLLSPRNNLSFVDHSRQWSSNSLRLRVTEIHSCLHRLNLFLSRSTRRQWSRQSRRWKKSEIRVPLLDLICRFKINPRQWSALGMHQFPVFHWWLVPVITGVQSDWYQLWLGASQTGYQSWLGASHDWVPVRLGASQTGCQSELGTSQNWVPVTQSMTGTQLGLAPSRDWDPVWLVPVWLDTS